MNTSKALIKESQLAEFLRVADSWVTRVEWQPQGSTPPSGELQRQRLLAQVQATPAASLIENLKQVRKDGSTYLGEAEYRTLFACRRGIQIGMAVAKEFSILEGSDRIGDTSKLSSDKRTELQEKTRSAAAIVLFTMARFAAEHLTGANDDEAHREHVQLPECVFDDPVMAIRCALFYLSANILHPKVNNDKALTSTVRFFFEKIIGEVQVRKATFKHLERFQKITFGLEGSEFVIDGLERHDVNMVSVEFNRVERKDVVGNADAKHFIRRQSRRICCYSVREQKNVFVELGGLMDPWLGYGKPGTGKSMLIANMATELDDLCKALNVPFLFHPLPDNLIDSFQGNSARNMVNWMKVIQDPGKIIFASIDDGENVLEERTRQGVSEGVRAVIGVFLRYTEGAYAIRRGNATTGIMSNIPEQLDAAVRSRVQGRMVIDGAVTVEDALDQSQLWWSKKYGSQKKFVNLNDPDWYRYQDAQKDLKSAAEAAQTRDAPEHAIMREIFDRVAREYPIDSHEFFARLYVDVEERYPLFSSRDKRNIYSAVDLRVMDFDIPDEWFGNQEVFHNQPYDRQKEMVLELRNANMKGLKFGDILRQEWVRYLDNYARIADAEFDREVDAHVKEFRIRKEVERRLKEAGDVSNA